MNPEGGTPPDDGPHDPWLEARVSRLEDDMGEIRGTLRRLEPMIIRMDANMAHLATRAELLELRVELKGDIASLRHDLSSEIGGVKQELSGQIGGVKGEIADLKAALADKPSRTYMWGIMTAMVAAFACGIAGLAVLK